MTPADAKQAIAPFVQVSIFHRSIRNGHVPEGEDAVAEVREVVDILRQREIQFVLHPIGFPLSETHPAKRERTLHEVKDIARLADRAFGIIVHDEVCADSSPLRSKWLHAYQMGIKELREICPVSVENAADSRNVTAFWQRIANEVDSFTLDLGHLEASRLKSKTFVQKLDPALLKKIRYVHVHRNGAARPGMTYTDHWPLTPGCAEVAAYKALRETQQDVDVVLEVDGPQNWEDGLGILVAVEEGEL